MAQNFAVDYRSIIYGEKSLRKHLNFGQMAVITPRRVLWNWPMGSMFVSNTIVVLFQHEINVCVVVDDFVLFCCLPNKANLINRRSLDKTNQNVIGASFQWPTYIPIGSWSFLSYCCSGIRTVGFCIFLLLAVWPHLAKATAKPSLLHHIITHSSRAVVLAQLVERSLKSPRFESSQWPNFYWT